MNQKKLRSLIKEAASDFFGTEFDRLAKDFRKSLTVDYCAGIIVLSDFDTDDRLKYYDAHKMILDWIAQTDDHDVEALEELLPGYKAIVSAAEQRIKRLRK